MRRRFVVHGLVQGVNFRAAAAEEARKLGVLGRVRNRDDGAVECIAEGDRAALDRFAQWLARGPRLARVERVEAEELTGERSYTDFRITF